MKVLSRGCLVVCAGLLLTGCGGDDDSISYDHIGDNNPGVIVCVGDSITGDSNYPGVPPYPSILQNLEPEKTIINEGHGNATSGDGAGRIGGVLSKHQPAAVLILYGAVDILRGTRHQTVANNIRSIIQQVKANQSIPVVATMLPVTRTSAWEDASRNINVLIREVAEQEGAKLVDLEKEFSGSEAELLPDGLHPNIDGVNIIAMAFSEKI